LGIGNVKRHLQPTGRKQQQTAGYQTEGKQPPKASPETPPHQEQLNQKEQKISFQNNGLSVLEMQQNLRIMPQGAQPIVAGFTLSPDDAGNPPHCRFCVYPGAKFWVRRLSISAFFLSIHARPKG
jgi:hypothetical protein